MSIAVSNLIWQKSLHKGSALLTLLAMADWASDDGSSVYPSMQTLATKTRLSRRQVVNIVMLLEASGAIAFTGKYYHQVKVFRIDLQSIGSEKIAYAKISHVKPASHVPVKKLHTTSEAGFTQSVSNPLPNPLVSGGESAQAPRLVTIPPDATVTPRPSAIDPDDIPQALKSQPKPPTPRQRAAATQTVYQHPAVLAYINVFGVNPNPVQAGNIVREVTDVPKWGSVCQQWSGAGYRKESVDKMLTVYREGWKARDWPGSNGKSEPTRGKSFRRQQATFTDEQREASRRAAAYNVQRRAYCQAHGLDPRKDTIDRAAVEAWVGGGK